MKVMIGLAAAAIALAGVTATPVQAQQYSDSYQFLKAIKDRDGEATTKLLASPGNTKLVDTHEQSGTQDGALHILVRGRDATWLRFIVGKNANVDIKNKEGATPLSIAAQLGWLEGADILLARRAKVDQPNVRGETPLIIAVHNRDVAMVRLLLSKGANPKITDSVAGYSALDYARQDGRAATIAKLLEETKPAPSKVAGPSL
jgi:ankyrin repeat protein